MSLPILAYGHDLLHQSSRLVEEEHPQLDTLIQQMWMTMEQADGCGLAAVQVGHPIRLFVIDSRQIYDDMNDGSRVVYFEKEQGLREVFINARMIDQSERTWIRAEACLSLPGMQEDILRHWWIEMAWQNEQFEHQQRRFCGINARMIQHELDHTMGLLYTDRLGDGKKKKLTGRLKRIARGKYNAAYPMQLQKPTKGKIAPR